MSSTGQGGRHARLEALGTITTGELVWGQARGKRPPAPSACPPCYDILRLLPTHARSRPLVAQASGFSGARFDEGIR